MSLEPTIEHTFYIEAADAGTRADVFVAAKHSVSRSRAQKLIESATLNGAPIKPSHALKIGDELKLAPPNLNPEPQTLNPITALPPILFEDEHLIVVNKPRGLSVHAGAGEPQATLVATLQASGRTLSSVGPSQRAGIVHRLDKDTSGVMVVCKTDAAHWKLAEDFATRRVQKWYRALVCGVPPLRGRIEAPLDRHPTNRKKMAISRNGRPSITEYEVETSWPRFALLKIDLLTGRTHQIRVHLTHIGYAVVGDDVYGGGRKRALDAAPNDAFRAALDNLKGQALHAAELNFAHPISSEAMHFEAPLPPEVTALIEAL